jgi:hypothetical protein
MADDQVRKPTRVQCKKCEHTWIGFYLPMPISDAVRVMKNLTCPMCAAGAKHIRIFGTESKPDTEVV